MLILLKNGQTCIPRYTAELDGRTGDFIPHPRKKHNKVDNKKLMVRHGLKS